jgi:carbon storage regulator
MLILTRRVGETIHLGEGVVVTVLGMHGRQVRLGIVAPAAVSIRRGELSPREEPEQEEGGAADA